jgi:hypothetical protein
VAKAKHKASSSIRRLKPTAIHIPNISLMFNIYFFNSNYLHFILPLASASIAVGIIFHCRWLQPTVCKLCSGCWL